MSEPSSILNPRTTAIVAIGALALSIFGVAGFLWSVRMNSGTLEIVRAVENRDAGVINQHTARIEQMSAWEKKITDLEAKVQALETKAAEMEQQAALMAEDEAAPE